MPRKPRTAELMGVPLAFGNTIRELRLARGISQENLAYGADVSRAYMSGLECGRHSPTMDTILKLLWEMNISFASFAIVYERELEKLKCGVRKGEQNRPDLRSRCVRAVQGEFLWAQRSFR